MMLSLLLSVILLVLAADAAQAHFIAAPLAVAVLPAALVPVGTFLGTLGLTFGASYIAMKLLPKPDMPSSIGGAGGAVGGGQLDLRVDAAVPRSLIFGWGVTAGSLAYVKTWGTDNAGAEDEVRNSNLIEIRALADHPVDSLAAYVFVEGKKRTYSAFGANPDLGNSVEGFDDRLFFKFYDGSQTVADTVAVNRTAGMNAPWASTAVGHGVSYVRIKQEYNQKLITGLLDWKFVVKGIKLYDPRKDTSVGGSGAHRFSTLSTHEWTDNPMVMAYNVLRGIYVADESGTRQHFYGLKRTAADQLPLTEWFAAMNACDVDTSASNTTNRYRCGGEVTVDTEPKHLIEELLKCCGGRIVEVGGVYKAYVGEPETASLEFTDDDLIDTEDSYKPIQPLDQRINYVTGSYTNPTHFVEKVAPPRTDAALEAEDGRRLPAELTAPMVQYGPQMQRLMRQYLNRSRRFRKHKLTLPPSAFGIEPGQIVSWTSTRNGYIGKLFEVDGVEHHSNLCVTLALTEVDPDDYSWLDAFESAEDDGVLPTVAPGAKALSGFSAVGVVAISDGPTPQRRPAIRVFWSDPLDADITAVRFQVRRAGDTAQVMTASSPDPTEGTIVIGGVLALTAYEVRARFVSANDYEVTWSDWMPVTTPDVKLSSNDFVADLKQKIDTGIDEAINVVRDSVGALNTALRAEIFDTEQEFNQRLGINTGTVKSYVDERVTTLQGADAALSQRVDDVVAEVGGLGASASTRFVAAVTPLGGALASYQLTATAENARTGLQVVAIQQPNGSKISYVLVDAGKFMVGKSNSDDFSDYKPFMVVDTGTGQVVINGEILAQSLKVAKAQIGQLSTMSADLGTVTAGIIRFIGSAGKLEITSNPARILISELI